MQNKSSFSSLPELGFVAMDFHSNSDTKMCQHNLSRTKSFFVFFFEQVEIVQCLASNKFILRQFIL